MAILSDLNSRSAGRFLSGAKPQVMSMFYHFFDKFRMRSVQNIEEVFPRRKLLRAREAQKIIVLAARPPLPRARGSSR